MSGGFFHGRRRTVQRRLTRHAIVTPTAKATISANPEFFTIICSTGSIIVGRSIDANGLDDFLEPPFCLLVCEGISTRRLSMVVASCLLAGRLLKSVQELLYLMTGYTHGGLRCRSRDHSHHHSQQTFLRLDLLFQ